MEALQCIYSDEIHFGHYISPLHSLERSVQFLLPQESAQYCH